MSGRSPGMIKGRSPGMIKGAAGKGMVPSHMGGKGHPRMDGKGRLAFERGKEDCELVMDRENDRSFQNVSKRGFAMTPAPVGNLLPPSCEACGNFCAILHCSRCKTALYCDEICQRRAWPTHKANCQPPDEILSTFSGDPNAFVSTQNDMIQEAKDIAASLGAFFARGGRKTQARLRSKSASSAGSTASSSSRASSVNAHRINNDTVETSDDSFSYLSQGQDNPDACVDDEEVDAKRPAWLQRKSLAQGNSDPVHDSLPASFPRPVPIAKDEGFVLGRPVYGSVESSNARDIQVNGQEALQPQRRVTGGGVVALRNGAEMPRIVLGTAGYAGLSGKEGREAICAALKLGYRAIDTSEMNRNLLDVAWSHLKAGIPRKDLFIIAKIAPWNYGHARTHRAFSRQLAELRVDYVDLVLLQWPHCWAPLQKEWDCSQWRKSGHWKAIQRKGSWRALEEIYGTGKARAIGVSNFTIDHLTELFGYCQEKPHVIQCESHPHWTNKHVKNFCREHEIAFQGYAPLGGQYRDTDGRAIDCEVIGAIAERNRVSPARVCLFWSLCRNASVVVKSKVYHRLQENLEAIDDLKIPSADLAIIDAESENHKKYGPAYWGHNDTDFMNPWRNEEELMQEMAVNPGTKCGQPVPLTVPKTDRPAPQPPAASFAPEDRPVLI